MPAKRSNGTCRARFRDTSGRQHSKDFTLRKDAAAWERARRADIDRGVDLDIAAARKITVREFAERWLADLPHRESTARTRAYVLGARVFPDLGDRLLASLRPSDLAAFQRGLRRRYSPNTVAATMRLLSQVLRAAVADRLLASNPMELVKRAPVPRGDYILPTVEEVGRLVDAMPAEFRPYVALGAGCGLRPSESLGVAAGDVDWLRRTLSVQRQVNGTTYELGPLKTPSSERAVPIPDWAVEVLAEYVAEFGRGSGTLMARSDGRPVAHTTIGSAWKVARKAAGCDPGLRPHDLRHFAASLLIVQGVPVTDVAAFLGHSSPTITLSTYAHLWPDSETRVRSVLNTAWTSVEAKVRPSGSGK